MLDDILRGPLSFHAVAPPVLEPFDGIEIAIREAAREVSRDPRNAQCHAAIGNGFLRQKHYLEAIAAYHAAVNADPSFGGAHLALAELLYVARNEYSRAVLARALELQRVYPDPLPAGDRTSVLMLLRDEHYSVNTPLEQIVDRERIALHKYFLEGNVDEDALPKADVLFCAFGYAHAALPAIERASAYIAKRGLRAINRPDRLVGTAREHLHETLAACAHVVVPPVRIARPDGITIDGPTLVRPIDTHAGNGLALVNDAAELQAHLARHAAESYYVAPFVEYKSPDTYYRKYRVMLIDGKPYPYHCGISPRWMIHYWNAPMAQYDWMREEEAAFLRDPASVFPHWERNCSEIAQALGLDYVGIDCARLPDGTMLVFEADAAMLIHDEVPGSIFDYKRAAVARIRNAITALIGP